MTTPVTIDKKPNHDALIAMCVMGAWDNKDRQQTWLNRRIKEDGIDVVAFDAAATEWATRHNHPKPQTFGATLRGV